MSRVFFGFCIFISFCTWRFLQLTNCLHSPKKIFEEERIKDVLYSKQDLRHEKQVEQGLGNTQHLQDNTDLRPPHRIWNHSLPGAEGPPAFHGYFIFPFYSENMHGSVFAPKKTASRQISVK